MRVESARHYRPLVPLREWDGISSPEGIKELVPVLQEVYRSFKESLSASTEWYMPPARVPMKFPAYLDNFIDQVAIEWRDKKENSRGLQLLSHNVEIAIVTPRISLDADRVLIPNPYEHIFDRPDALLSGFIFIKSINEVIRELANRVEYPDEMAKILLSGTPRSLHGIPTLQKAA